VYSWHTWNEVSGTPGSGNIVHCEEMGLGFRYGGSTGGRGKQPQGDNYLD